MNPRATVAAQAETAQVSEDNPKGINRKCECAEAAQQTSAKVPQSIPEGFQTEKYAPSMNGNPAELPADLKKLAALWPAIPAAVRDGWLATAEALTRSKGHGHA